jgi:hypothetical protein
LTAAFDSEKGIGAYISVWIPSSVEWMTSESDDLPSVGLYYEGTKRRTVDQGRQVSRAITELPSKCRRIDAIEYGTFTCVQQMLDDQLKRERLRELDVLRNDLTRTFVTFTKAVKPGLVRARALADERRA